MEDLSSLLSSPYRCQPLKPSSNTAKAANSLIALSNNYREEDSVNEEDCVNKEDKDTVIDNINKGNNGNKSD